MSWPCFSSPEWLFALLLIPLVVFQSRRSLAGLGAIRRWVSMALRVLLVAVAVLALAEAGWLQVSREVTTIFLMDRSASISATEQQKIFKYMASVSALREKDGRGSDDLAGLVVLAKGAVVELAPRENFNSPQWMDSSIGIDHTDIGEGLRMAAASFPAGSRKRVVLISDGGQTRGEAFGEARRLAEAGVTVEVLPLHRLKSPEMLVERVAVRSEAREGEAVDVRVVLRASQAASGQLELLMDGQLVGSRSVRMSGQARLLSETFSVRLEKPGFYSFDARLRPASGCDTIKENNCGYGFTRLSGKARVLIIYAPGEGRQAEHDLGPLIKVLSQEKIEVQLAGLGSMPTSSAELAGFDCIVIVNTPAHAFTRSGMEAIKASVRDMGTGLVMIGGANGFGAGGYLNTPIEDALPVSCDVRQRKVMPNGALVLVMHTCEMPQPNYWGRRISQAAIDVLSDQDQAGLILFDWSSGCSWLFPIQNVGPARKKMRSLINTAQPGDMPDFDSSLKLALKGLKAASAALKHCIVISDGDPSLSNALLLRDFKNAKITVSTVAIAPHGGSCEKTLFNVARVTGGRYYFPKSPSLLPQIFVKEAMTVRRSVIYEGLFTPTLVMATGPLKGFDSGQGLPPLQKYVLTTARQRAQVPITARIADNPADPVLAYWQYGEGKAVAFTSSAATDWAPGWVDGKWGRYRQFWSQVVRWASRVGGGGELQVRSVIRDGQGRIVVEAIDENGNMINHLDIEGHVLGPDSKVVPGVDFVQTAPGRYEAKFPAGPSGAYQVVASYTDQAGTLRHNVTGASNSYSPEYLKFKGNPQLLQDIAEVTGGHVLSWDALADSKVIWARNLPPGYRTHPGWEWLLWAILILFPLDVAVRRVMIDWGAVNRNLQAAWIRLNPFSNADVPVAPDSTMSALMAQKQRIRDAAPTRPAGNVRNRFLDQLQAAREESGVEDDGLRDMLLRHKERRASVSAGKAAGGGKAAPPKAAGISGYASSLLEAKKKALSKKKKSGLEKDKKDNGE